MLPCGHQHEIWFDVRDISVTAKKVQQCPLRQWGKNLLCAHTALFPGDQDIFEILKKRCQSFENKDIEDILNFVKQVNNRLDNLVRASYIHWSFWWDKDIFPNETIWRQSKEYFQSLIQILEESIWKKRPLNIQERKRFNNLVLKIQKRTKEILEGEVLSKI